MSQSTISRIRRAHPAPRQEYKTPFGFGVFHHFQLQPVLFCGLSRSFARITLVDVCHCDVVAGQLLHRPGQLADLGAILIVGRSHMQGQQVPQRIHGGMDLRALAPFGSVVSGPRTRLRCRLQRAAIENHRLETGPRLIPAEKTANSEAQFPLS